MKLRNLVTTPTLYSIPPDPVPDWPLSDNAKSLRTLLLEPLFPPEAGWGSAKVEDPHISPIGTISIYNWLKKRGYQVDFLDTQFDNFNPEKLKNILINNPYNVVAIPVYTPTADYSFATADLVKSILPDCKVVMGNIHVSMMPELSMEQCPSIDFIIRHEGEFTMDEFLSTLAEGKNQWSKIKGLVFRENGAIKINPQRSFINNLDILPLGMYHDINLSRYVPHVTQYVVLPTYNVVTQRGCPNSCTYCGASLILGKKVRQFSPERIIEELKILVEKHGAKGIYFQDSTFTINRKYTMKLMELMIKENLGLLWLCNTRADRVDPELLHAMYEAGGRVIVLGIESGNQESLDVIKKNTTVEIQTQGVEWIRKAGFRFLTSFILCLPGETEEMVKNTIDYALSLKAHWARFYLPVPYPGTQLFEACKKDAGLRNEGSWSDFLMHDFKNPIYINPNFSTERMVYWYRYAHMKFYGSPIIWWENLKALRTMSDLEILARGGRVVATLIANGVMNSLFPRKQSNG